MLALSSSYQHILYMVWFDLVYAEAISLENKIDWLRYCTTCFTPLKLHVLKLHHIINAFRNSVMVKLPTANWNHLRDSRLNWKHTTLPYLHSSRQFLYCTYSVSRTWNWVPVLFMQDSICRPNTDLTVLSIMTPLSH